MQLPNWARRMVHKLVTSFLLGEKPECRKTLCILGSVWVLQLRPLWGSQHRASSELAPSASGLEGLVDPERLCLQFCHWLLILCILVSFPPSTFNMHIHRPISISWHFKGKKWCFYRSTLQNSAAPLHLKTTGMFCGIGLLLIRYLMHVLSCHSARMGASVICAGERRATYWVTSE